MRGTYSGSGNASRIGRPSIARPGNVSRITSLIASQTCSRPRCKVTVSARAVTGPPDVTLIAPLPFARAIPVASDLRRLPIQQHMMAGGCDNPFVTNRDILGVYAELTWAVRPSGW